MKIRFYFTRFMVIVLALSMLSCENIMKSDSDMKLKAEDHYSSIGEIYGAFIGLYASFTKIAEKTIILSGLKGDLLQPTQNAPEDYWRVYRYEGNSNSTVNNAKEYYDVVINCNDFLKRVIAYNKEVPGDIPANVYKGMISQAISFKVWCLMSAGKLFGEARIYSSVVSSDSEEGMYTLTLDELPEYLMTYMQGGEDGVNAFNALDWTVVLGNTTATWPGRNMSADALYGELALWAGHYQEAIDRFLPLLSPDANTSRNLSSYGGYSWVQIFADLTDAKEMITTLTFEVNYRQENLLKYYFSNQAPNVYYFAPSQKAVDYFTSQRQNADQSFRKGDVRGEGVSYNLSGSAYAVGKYDLSYSDYVSDAYVPVYRAGGIHLMLAEAFTFLGNYEAALAILNQGIGNSYYVGDAWQDPFKVLFKPFATNCKGIRSRVLLEDLDKTEIFNECLTAADSLASMSGQIADEVARELAYEGQRWFTLIRMGKNMNKPEFVADRVAGKFGDGQTAYYKEILKNENNWFIK